MPTFRVKLAAFVSVIALGLTLGLHAAGVAPTNVLNTAADLAGKTLVTAEGNRTITGTFSWNVPVRLNPGTTAAPGLVSTSDQTTGWQLSVNAIGGSISGAQKFLLNTSGLALFGVQTINGSGVAQVVGGGTGVTSGTSGGVLGFTAGTTLASSAALTQNGVLIGGGAGALPSSLAACTTGQVVAGVTSAAPTCQTATGIGSVVLLKANNGSDTSAGATTLDSVATGALTANDRIKVEYTLTSVTQNTANIILYSVTDATSLLVAAPNPLAAGDVATVNATVSQLPGTATSYVTMGLGSNGASAALTSLKTTAGLTSWLTGFTIGIRHGGVTAGGTLKWSWAVYKIVGQ